MKNCLFVISGPSGVGKGTLVERLMKSDEFILSISCTTREPRDGESNGKSYFFLTEQEFMQCVERGDFLEYDKHFEHWYATPRAFVEEKLKEKSVVLEIDVVGSLNVKKSYPEAILIMLLPPSKEELIKRLRGRGTETEKDIEKRIARVDYELAQSHQFNYTVVNADINETERIVKEIILKEINAD